MRKELSMHCRHCGGRLKSSLVSVEEAKTFIPALSDVEPIGLISGNTRYVRVKVCPRAKGLFAKKHSRYWQKPFLYRSY